MAYSSPYDLLLDWQPLDSRTLNAVPDILHPLQGYDGTLAEVLDDLEMVRLPDTRGLELAHRALHPPRVLRAVMDYRIDNSAADPDGTLMGRAIETATEFYRGDERASIALKGLRREIRRQGLQDLLERPLVQERDVTTNQLCSPHYSRQTAGDLADATRGEPLLLIALGHGGTAAGLDVALRYQDLAGSDARYYPVRLSTRKLGDKEPRLREDEKAMLRDEAQGRAVVIFDEDIASGRTIALAERRFGGEVFPGRPLLFATNNNTYPEERNSYGYTRFLDRGERYDAIASLALRDHDITPELLGLLAAVKESDESREVSDLANALIENHAETGDFRYVREELSGK